MLPLCQGDRVQLQSAQGQRESGGDPNSILAHLSEATGVSNRCRLARQHLLGTVHASRVEAYQDIYLDVAAAPPKQLRSSRVIGNQAACRPD